MRYQASTIVLIIMPQLNDTCYCPLASIRDTYCYSTYGLYHYKVLTSLWTPLCPKVDFVQPECSHLTPPPKEKPSRPPKNIIYHQQMYSSFSLIFSYFGRTYSTIRCNTHIGFTVYKIQHSIFDNHTICVHNLETKLYLLLLFFYHAIQF